MEEYMESECQENKTCRLKYNAWVARDSAPNCLCCVVYLTKETCKCTEPDY